MNGMTGITDLDELRRLIEEQNGGPFYIIVTPEVIDLILADLYLDNAIPDSLTAANDFHTLLDKLS